MARKKGLTRLRGWIAAAGLDVLETEPPDRNDPVLRLDNVVLTPHIASYSDRFHESFWTHSVKTLVRLAENGADLDRQPRGHTPAWTRCT